MEIEPNHSFFRSKALQEYLQRQEKDILPCFFSPYLTTLSSLLLSLLILLGLLVWRGEIPVFLTGSGMVLAQDPEHISRNHEMGGMLFLPAKDVSLLHPGEDAVLRVEPAGQQFTGTVKYATLVGPDEVRKWSLMNAGIARILPQSSVVAIFVPVATHIQHLEAGDVVSAQIHIGSQSILSFCFGLQ
jgi:hypothetical protein